MSTLSTALRPCSFAYSLFARSPITLGEMHEREVEFIRIEEMRVVQKRPHEENASSSGQEKKKGKTFIPNERKKGKKFKDGPEGSRFDRYTPLNMPRARVLEEVLSSNLLPPLKKKPTPKNVNDTKHCLYHQNVGHTT